ncbi:hypothetical protein C8Q79DRAFT_909544 [Trametes meyenii]|nr:hypothetical protein C8Q79DRAFT_909544 [Trametes meyenii]
MFKTAARKIAHNTTMPGLPGLSAKQDLRALQDLITAEKAILNSLQRLSSDFGRASEALRAWGQGEGEDLADTLSASTMLLLHFSTALGAFATHEAAVREHMKAVRSREEALDEMKRRRKSVFSDAEAAERKLSKMNPENKNLQQQTDLLNRLREEIRAMDTDIMTEEAGLGDFKRVSARNWMGLKFGGLLECCEKGVVAGELGKLVITEIPLEPAQPGLPRPYYTGHARTEFLVAEATRSVSEVFYSPEPNPNPSQRTIRSLPGSELPPVPSPSQRRLSGTSASGQSGFLPMSPPQGAYPGLPQVDESGFNIQQFMAPATPQEQHPPVSEFGSFSGSPYPPQAQTVSAAEREKAASPRGGRFATFPVKAGGPRPIPGGSSLSNTNPYISSPPLRDGDRAPSLEIDRGHESFSSSVALALGGQLNLGDSAGAGPSAQGPSTSSSRFSAPQGPPHPDVKNGDFAPQRYSPPPPMYTPSDGNQLPLGAAPPNPPSSLHSGLAPRDYTQNGGSRPHSTAEEDDGLAYMLHDNESAESLSNSGDRRVRFGGVSDVDQELEKRHAEEAASDAAAAASASASASAAPATTERAQSPSVTQTTNGALPGRISPEVTRTSQPTSPTREAPPPVEADRSRSPSSPSQARIPSPPLPVPPADSSDEQSLNAAAAREVSRELDALMMSSPPVSPLDKAPTSPSWSSRPQYASSPYPRQGVSPRPSIDSPTSGQASQASSPKLEGMYVRQRDRSGSSPVSRSVAPESIPAPVSPVASNEGSDQMQRSIPSLPRISPAPTGGSVGSPYRTPLETPLGGPPPTGSFYNLASSTGSNASFSSPGPGGVRTISAAAFRRPVRNASGTLLPEGGRQSPGLADTSPLNVKKRPLPSSPFPSPHLSANLQAPGGIPRSVSASGGPPGGELGVDDQGARPLTHYHQEDDYDYISAYTDAPGTAGPGDVHAHGYSGGRFATNLEDGDGIR